MAARSAIRRAQAEVPRLPWSYPSRAQVSFRKHHPRAKGEPREAFLARHVDRNVAYRIVSTGVLGLLLLTASACTLTVQSGPSSPAYVGYAPEAAPQNPVYVPVVSRPARTPGNAVAVACPPATIPSPATPSPVTPASPQPATNNRPVFARVPMTEPPRASNMTPRSPSPAPTPTPASPPRLGRTAGYPSGSTAHTPAPLTPVSATVAKPNAPQTAITLPSAPSPLTVPAKPGGPRALRAAN